VSSRKKPPDVDKLNRAVVEARREHDRRVHGFRARALEMFPWICARCGREFTQQNLSELTVHHRDHDHDNNPPDGSNWELLCLYCHDNEHARYLAGASPGKQGPDSAHGSSATYKPFSALDALLKNEA
jgi:hypothetical protein